MIAPTIFFSSRGASIRILEEIRHLRDFDVKTRICTYRKGDDVPGIDIRRVPYTPKDLRFGPTYHRLYLDVLLAMLSLSAKRQFRPDILHAHLHEGALIARMINRFPHVPVVLDAQGSLVGEMLSLGFVQKGSFRYTMIRKLEDRIVRKVDAIIVSSKKLKDLYLQEFEIEPSKIEVVQDGVDYTHFVLYEKKDPELMEALGIREGSIVIVYLGSIERQQGIETILEAAASIMRKRNDLHLLIMGAPVDLSLDDCNKLASQLGISTNVTITGKINYSEAPHYLSLGDIAIAAKYSESESDGKVLTYMAMGLPIVCTDTEINRYFAGSDALYFKPMDHVSLAEKIEKLLEISRADRIEIGRSLRERAKNIFSWNVSAEKVYTIYKKLV